MTILPTRSAVQTPYIQTSKATAFWNKRKSCETSHFVNCRTRVEAPPAALMRGKKQDRRNFNGESGRRSQCMAHAARKPATNSQGPPSRHYAWGGLVSRDPILPKLHAISTRITIRFRVEHVDASKDISPISEDFFFFSIFHL